MQDFLDKISGTGVRIKPVESEDLGPYSGYAYIDEHGVPIIEVSNSIQKGMDGTLSTKSFIRGFLLHELGHLSVPEDGSPYMNEYNAHMWAITKAEELGFTKITSSLREEIISWRLLGDADCFKKYRKASDRYVRTYGLIP